jgi:hypothetical protein
MFIARNILVVDGRGKLADLEYARIIETEGHHSIRAVRQCVWHFPTIYLSYNLRKQLPSWRWRSLMVITISLRLRRQALA